MISLSSLRRVESKHFPISIETLIEQDLQKLQKASQEGVNDDGNEDDSDVEEKGDVEEPKKAEGDAEKEGIEGPPGSDCQDEDEEPEDYFDDEDLDPIILGVRIYTKGRVAVSLTGQVVGEGINEDEDEDEEDKDKNLKTATKESAKVEGQEKRLTRF